ncbi:hypothetical protein MBLNU13_g08477t2 [Cladosporium sp. NU13]
MTISEVYEEAYEVIEQWHSQPRHVRIVAVGAGASGLCVAYKAQRNLRNYELQFNSSVKEAVCNEEEGKYAVKIQTVEGEIDDWCHVLVNGTGYLYNWKCAFLVNLISVISNYDQFTNAMNTEPAIDGLHDFAGTLLHSANS